MRETRKNPALLIRAAAILIFAVTLIWSAAAPRAFAAKKSPPSTPVNINEATLKELEEVPGIGPTTAKAIIQFRTRSGRFRRVNDLLVIRGVSEGKLAKMRPYVTVGTPPVAVSATAAPKKASPSTQPHTAQPSTASTSSTKPAQPKSPGLKPKPPAQPSESSQPPQPSASNP